MRQGDSRRNDPAPDRPVFFGVSWWNRRAVAALFGLRSSRGAFFDDFDRALDAARTSRGTLVAWASKLAAPQESAAEARAIPLIRIEDGFLRSVGLGAGLTAGSSYALDSRGIYYDATRPSDLEHLLQTHNLSEMDITLGYRLVDAIRQARVSKYNVGQSTTLSLPSGGERILVPGQVAADAAIARTISRTVDLTSAENPNLALLRSVRCRNPGATIVYKPHPDVAAGLRPGAIARQDVLQFADRIEADANIVDLIDATDRVETLSSLAGFEALLRGRAVTVHGLPFYAGWGLTDDLTACARRTRARALHELVFLALVAYGRYVDPVSLEPCSAEEQIARLHALRQKKSHWIRVTARRHLSWLGRRLGI